MLRRGGKNTQKNCTKDLHDPDNHDDVITNLEPDILECEVKEALQIAVKRREVKSKREKERNKHLNAEFKE